MADKLCAAHHTKIIAFCVSPSCQLRTLCSLCIVQHMKEIHAESSAFGDIQLLNLDPFYEKCRDKLEKAQPKYRVFMDELETFRANAAKRLIFEKLIDKTQNIKRKIQEILDNCFETQIEQYKDFYQKQSLQIAEKLNGLQEKLKGSADFIDKILDKSEDPEAYSSMEFTFLQKVFTESLDLELEKKKTIFQKLNIELQHINMQNSNIETSIEAFLKSFSMDLNDFLSKILVKTTANTSLVGLNESKSAIDLQESVIFTNFYRENLRKEEETRFLNNNRSLSNLMSIKTEEEEKDEEISGNQWKKRSFTPNRKTHRDEKLFPTRNKRKFGENPKIEELIEEENARNSISEKKTQIQREAKKLLKPDFSQEFHIEESNKKKTNKPLKPQIVKEKETMNNPIKGVFPEKNFQNYLIYIANLSYKKYNMMLFTQEFTRKVASLKPQSENNKAIFAEFQKQCKLAENLKKPPQEISFLYQDYSGDYFFLSFPWDYARLKTVEAYYLVFNEENQEKLEKFRNFINGAKLLLNMGLENKEMEVIFTEIYYELGIAKNCDLLRLAICYHIQNNNRKKDSRERVLSIEELLDFKKKYIS